MLPRDLWCSLWMRPTWNLKTTSGWYSEFIVFQSGPCHQVPCGSLPGCTWFCLRCSFEGPPWVNLLAWRIGFGNPKKPIPRTGSSGRWDKSTGATRATAFGSFPSFHIISPETVCFVFPCEACPEAAKLALLLRAEATRAHL